MNVSKWHLLALIIAMSSVTPCSAAPMLYGGVAVNGDLPAPQLKAIEPKRDDTAPKEDCVCFNPSTIEVKEIGGSYKLVDSNHWILDFAEHRDEGVQAMNIIKHYKLNNLCFVGRPFADGQIKMMYFTSDGAPPEGAYPGEDAIPFQLSKISAKNINGSWKIVEEPDHWMMDFGNDEKAARNAESILNYYGFTHECFVGRPGAPLMYFRK